MQDDRGIWGSLWGNPTLPQIEEGSELVNQKQPSVDGGKIARDYKPGKGGIVVFDDGDIEEELDAERDAYLALVDMPEVDEMRRMMKETPRVKATTPRRLTVRKKRKSGQTGTKRRE